MKRLAAFLRCVIPADPWQLVFLMGAVFLLISPRLFGGLEQLLSAPAAPNIPDGLLDRNLLMISFSVCGVLTSFAAFAALFLCFRPTTRPGRWIMLAVLFPSVVSFCFLHWELFRSRLGNPSLFESRNMVALFVRWFRFHTWDLPTGSYFAASALVLITIFAYRLGTHASSLPITLPGNFEIEEAGEKYWFRVQLPIFVLLGPIVFISGSFALPFVTLIWKLPLSTASPATTNLISHLLFYALDASVLLGVPLVLIGKSGWRAAQLSLRLPKSGLSVLALVLPVALSALIPTAHFLFEWFQWSAHEFGKVAPPQFVDYFNLSAFHLSLLGLIFGAFAEEIIFRGVLLRDLVGRYGLQRGIFLIGLVWASVHFRTDSFRNLSVDGVLLQLLSRVLTCLAMNHVFAWMTLRWKSVIPCALSHAVSNIFFLSSVTSDVISRWEVEVVLWTIVAIILYRYWPPDVDQPEPLAAGAVQPDLAG